MMRAEHVHKFYPFSFRLTSDMRMADVPKRLHDILPNATDGSLLTDVFEFRRPRSTPDWSLLLKFQSSSFEITSVDRGARFRGSVLNADAENIWFIIAPVFRDLQEVNSLGFRVDDFPPFDSTLDTLLLHQSTTMAIRDAETMSDRLNQAHSRSMSTITQLKKEVVKHAAGSGQGRAVSALLHDLFSPIALIMAATQLAQDSMNIAQSAADEAPVDWKKLHTYQKEVSEFLSHTLESTYRARDLIRTFKDISIDQTSAREREVVLVEYIRNLMLTFKPLFHQHTVTVDVSGDETVTNRRPGLIAQMLTNLVENTVKHGFEHQKVGTIRIDISREEEDILIDYSDDGAGMDAETLAKHLEPFFTSKAQHGGSGLGTYTIQTIIEESFGGTVKVESAPGKGTRYLLRYPA
jgi:signal transduction histidine kinase